MQDYGDLVVHVFDAETRKYYGLEEFWADARAWTGKTTHSTSRHFSGLKAGSVSPGR